MVLSHGGPTDFHSAVIALSSFKLCLLEGGTGVLPLSEN